MRSYINYLIQFSLLFLLLPYVGIWGVVGMGTQPNFYFFLLMLIVLIDSKLVFKILLTFIIFSLLELIFLVFWKLPLLELRFDLILLMCVSFFYKDILFNFNKKNLINKAILGLPLKTTFLMFATMFLASILSSSLASDINQILTGRQQFLDVLGISYFSPEPGLSSFGLFSFVVLLLVYQNKVNMQTGLVIFTILVFLISTKALTAIVLIGFLLLFYLPKIRPLYLLLIVTVVFLLFSLSSISDYLARPLEKYDALLSYNDSDDSSPAVRINNILALFQSFEYLTINRNALGVNPVGIVSYGVQLPITTLSFILLHLLRLSFRARFLFIFASIMLPLTNPFIFTIYLVNSRVLKITK